VWVQGPVPPRSRGTNFYDAVWLACKQKLASEAGRKGLVILTDAADTGSKVRLEEALEVAQRTDTVVHILLVWDPRYGADFGAAKKLAEETGGRVIEVRSEKKLEEAFDQIAEELRTQYTLGYYSTNAARDGKFRRIKIEIKRSGMKVLARRGYYALTK
jgi:VWFA-related protein